MLLTVFKPVLGCIATGRFKPAPFSAGLAGCLVWAAAAVAPGVGAAVPFTPANDSVVVERLPGRASDPATRRVESLRKQLAARPGDDSLRVDVARRYFEMAMAQGDPRYVGYASATIAPLAQQAYSNPGYWLVRGLIEQFSHDFDGALASLAKASALDSGASEPILWRAAIFMVQARYADAVAECNKLAGMNQQALQVGCTAYAQATNGQLAPAFAALQAAVNNTPAEAAEVRLWQYTRLGEMAGRLERPAEAEGFFKVALQLGITDQFLLGAYADLLLAQKRPQEAIELLADWERSDILLLRLALAGRDAKDSRASAWATQLRERFAAAEQRGDRLHEQEAARFALDIERKPAQALVLAERNYAVQKEPRDAEILMRAALAAGKPAAAQAALDWLRDSRYEDKPIAQIATQLVAKGAKGAKP